MKKVFLFALVGSLCMSTFAAVQTKVTGTAITERQAKYDKDIAEYKTKNIGFAYYLAVVKSLLTADVNTMDDVVANEAKVLATFTADEQKKIVESFAPGAAKASYGAILWWFPESLQTAALKFYAAKDDSYRVLYYLSSGVNLNKLGFTDKEAFDLYTKYIVKLESNDATTVKKLINSYVDLCTKVDDNSAAKATLKKLNLKYTKKLVEDKATWEPVVALIRTTIEVL